MKYGEFLERFVAGLRPALPAELQGFSERYQGALVKVYYGDSGVHYEIWLRSNGLLEIGLHFEASQETNERLLRYFSERAIEVIGQLGPQVDIEQWTKSWGRVHQTVSFTSPDEKLLAEAIERMAAMIAVLQPMLEEA